MGPTGWRRNSNSVTTPKLPPPPLMPQNRSAFSSSVGPHHLAVRGDDLGGDEALAGDPVLSLEPARAAAERQAGDTGVA